MPSRLATSMTAPAASRTWPTEPGAPVIPSACRVWIESITQTSGRSASSVASTGLDRGLGERRHRRAPRRRAARPAAGPAPPTPRRRRRATRRPARAEVAERHPGQGALADPGRAAEQDQRARHQAAAEHAVELGDPGAQPVDRRRLDLAQRHRPCGRRRGGPPAPRAGARRRGSAAPRPACSTPRSPGSARSRSARRGRTPGRRTGVSPRHPLRLRTPWDESTPVPQRRPSCVRPFDASRPAAVIGAAKADPDGLRRRER